MKKTVLLQVFQKANIFKKMQLFLAKRNTDQKVTNDDFLPCIQLPKMLV